MFKVSTLRSASVFAAALSVAALCPREAHAQTTSELTGLVKASGGKTEISVPGDKTYEVTNDPFKRVIGGRANGGNVTVFGRIHGATVHVLWVNAIVAFDTPVYGSAVDAENDSAKTVTTFHEAAQIQVLDSMDNPHASPPSNDETPNVPFVESDGIFKVRAQPNILGFILSDNVSLGPKVPVVARDLTGWLGGPSISVGPADFTVINDPFAAMLGNVPGSDFDQFTTLHGNVTDLGSGGYIEVTSINATASADTNLRDAPNGKAIGLIAKGTAFTIVGGPLDPPISGSVEHVSWPQVQLASGQKGFVSFDDVQIPFRVPTQPQTFTGQVAPANQNSSGLGFEIGEVTLDATKQVIHIWIPGTVSGSPDVEVAFFQALDKHASITGEIVSPAGFPYTVVKLLSVFATTSSGATVEVLGATDFSTTGPATWVVKQGSGTATVPFGSLQFGPPSSTSGLVGGVTHP